MPGKIMPALRFFRLDCDFFINPKIKALRRAHGTVGLATYLYILCKVYNEGYYIKVHDLDQFSYDIAESIANRQIASVAASVRESIDYMAGSVNLLDRSCLDVGILTSKAIQEQYRVINAQMKRKAQIGEYNLLTPNQNVEEIGINSEYMPINSEDMAINSKNMPRDRDRDREIKESKEKDDDTPLDLNSLDGFLSSEAEAIRTAFEQSSWLRDNITSTKWVRKNIGKIVSGYYRDFGNNSKVERGDLRYTADELDELFVHITDELNVTDDE